MHLCPPVVQVRLAALFRKVNQLPGRYAFNWRDNPTSLATYVDAMERHIAKLKDGEFIDMDTGESHVTMIMGNCAIIEDARLHDTLEKDIPAAAGAGRITRLLALYSAEYKRQIPEGVVKFEDGKDCGVPDCKAAECLATRAERMGQIINDMTKPLPKVRYPVGWGVFLAKYPSDRSEALPNIYGTAIQAQDAVDGHAFPEQYVVQPVFEDDEEPRERPHEIVSLDDEDSEC